MTTSQEITAVAVKLRAWGLWCVPLRPVADVLFRLAQETRQIEYALDEIVADAQADAHTAEISANVVRLNPAMAVIAGGRI